MAKPQLAKPLDIRMMSGVAMIGFEDAAGVVAAYKYAAQSEISLQVSPETTEILDEDTPTAETLLDIAKSVKRTGSLKIKNVTEEILAAFVLGSASTFSQSSTPVVDEVFTVTKGAHIYLGKSAANPAGAKNVTGVSIIGATEGTDYILDAAKGRFFIPLTSTMTDGAAATVDYTPAAETRERVASGGQSAKTAWLTFESDNAAGSNMTIDVPRVQMIPSGDWNLKDRDNPMNVSFDLKINTWDGYEQIYIDGEAA